MYDLQIEFPAPPIPRDRTFELDERVAATGELVHARRRQNGDHRAVASPTSSRSDCASSTRT
ncbi:MAG: hypothetical protein R2697_08335 [Ilumatobacteraceae bacterium]